MGSLKGIVNTAEGIPGRAPSTAWSTYTDQEESQVRDTKTDGCNGIDLNPSQPCFGDLCFSFLSVAQWKLNRSGESSVHKRDFFFSTKKNCFCLIEYKWAWEGAEGLRRNHVPQRPSGEQRWGWKRKHSCGRLCRFHLALLRCWPQPWCLWQRTDTTEQSEKSEAITSTITPKWDKDTSLPALGRVVLRSLAARLEKSFCHYENR